MTRTLTSVALTDQDKYFPKELSWLAFNERVLQEAEDPNNPVIERIRFLGIYSSNMDEFYRVRVASVRRKIIIYNDNGETELAKSTANLMTAIQAKVAKMSVEFDRLFKSVTAELRNHNVALIQKHELTEEQKVWLKGFFDNKVLRHIAPILIEKKVDLVSRLNDSVTYFYLSINRNNKTPKYATVEIPADKMSRFVILPHEKGQSHKQVILLDDVIQLFIEDIFRGFVKFDSIDSYSFKMTRDSEYSINDDIVDSYVEKMSDSMKQRLIAEPVRVVYDENMPADMVKSMKKHLRHSSYDNLIAAGRIRNVSDFIKFPNIGSKRLENKDLPAITSLQFSQFDTVFEAIKQQDILLYYPYHRFLHFTEFVRQAAFDPHVTHIRISIYRIAPDSRIVSSLIDAVDNGKVVTVIMELRARFDEEANIAWAKKMTDAGVRVVFGNPSFKVHTKLCVVTRKERNDYIHYAHIGTGNFNEKTAKIYTDFSLFTANEVLASEAISVFDLILLPYRQQTFEHLLVSPVNNKPKLLKLIRNEIKIAELGRTAKITLKVNNLVDHDLIDALYQASEAGVEIDVIVRGMCGLRPGIDGLSKNIKVISIVDRFLEHPRVMVFHNDGHQDVYISSADWMARNMHDRIEVGTPIIDDRLKKQIIDILQLQLKDTLKARVIDKHQVNGYVNDKSLRPLRSQLEIYTYLKNLEIKNDKNQGGV
ncbi:polyphosphate kinase 1 [Psychrosphaera ytuae]|uniref:Polyphosphate kinase n=1 Tax=Psychrosphaera ytuae TaxID=2820710 RepID=A0A975D8S5_9GAMM|nr:polyphosphate kinase 1 [Psychrosphaera ytuae]QTH62601.1 polyphosphate kinase 1 [Psychrosphaera ytuae]